MTDYLVLTEFIPGTKAKAQEINANFSAVKDAINGKAPAEGDSSKTFSVAEATNETHAVSKSQLNTLAEDVTKKINGTSSRFCAKTGNVTNGMADLFGFSNLTITPKVGGSFANLTVSNSKGEFKTFSSLEAINMSGKPDGTYNIYLKSDGTIYTLANKIYKQPVRPTMLSGDIWLNTSIEPLNAIKFEGTGDSEFLDVPLGNFTVANSVITTIETFAFNQNGYNVNFHVLNSLNGYRFPNYANGVSKAFNTWHTAPCDGWVHYSLSNHPYPRRLIVAGYSFYVGCYTSAAWDTHLVPISKGETFYGDSGESYAITETLKFIPAKGAN